jgi:Putative beta-barrel porin-2, OmpL-like. bbp2
MIRRLSVCLTVCFPLFGFGQSANAWSSSPPPPPPPHRQDKALTELREEVARLSQTVGPGVGSPLSADQRIRLQSLKDRVAELEAQLAAATRAIANGLKPDLLANSMAQLDQELAESRAQIATLEAASQPPDLSAEVARLAQRVRELEAKPPPAPVVVVTPEPAHELPAAPAPQPPHWYERIKLEGLAEAYYSYRVQGGPSTKTNELRAFDTANNAITPSFGKIALSLAPAPAGFRVDLAFGPVADLGSPDLGSPGAEVFKHLLQAYASAKLFDRLTIDFGKFVTSAGFEVFENNLNWLSSHSMIFAYGPYTHSGLRATYAINDLFSVQGGIVNGWDNIITAGSWKTFNVSAYATLPTTSIAFSFYGGPQSSPDVRLLFDLVVTQKFGDAFAMNIDGVVGVEGSSKWFASALSARYAFSDRFRLAARVEYFGDPDGHRTAFAGQYLNTSVGASVVVLNADGIGAVEFRPEVRHDQLLPGMSGGPGGGGGPELPAVQSGPVGPFVAGTSAHQTTLSVTMIASF